MVDYNVLRKKFPTKDPQKKKRVAAIKAINIMTRQASKEPPVPAPPTKEVVLLTEIRDELAKRGA